MVTSVAPIRSETKVRDLITLSIIRNAIDSVSKFQNKINTLLEPNKGSFFLYSLYSLTLNYIRRAIKSIYLLSRKVGMYLRPIIV